MNTNVEIKRKKNESNVSVIKRFTRKVQESGVLQSVKKNRFASRKPSDYVKKKNKLKALGKREVYNKLLKLGKIVPKTRGRK